MDWCSPFSFRAHDTLVSFNLISPSFPLRRNKHCGRHFVVSIACSHFRGTFKTSTRKYKFVPSFSSPSVRWKFFIHRDDNDDQRFHLNDFETSISKETVSYELDTHDTFILVYYNKSDDRFERLGNDWTIIFNFLNELEGYIFWLNFWLRFDTITEKWKNFWCIEIDMEYVFVWRTKFENVWSNRKGIGSSFEVLHTRRVSNEYLKAKNRVLVLSANDELRRPRPLLSELRIFIWLCIIEKEHLDEPRDIKRSIVDIRGNVVINMSFWDVFI